MNFQKQFDTVTGALNIFDMSYLISGTAMLGLLIYAFPEFKGFVFHKNQVILSVAVCIIIAYVLGMINWIAGKQFRCWIMKRFENKSKDDYLNSTFEDTAKHFVFKNETITKLMADSKSVAYSYMWMRLDKSQSEDCRNRFVYISRFWVLRAIYEGLILPVMFLSVTVFLRCYPVWNDLGEAFILWIGGLCGFPIYPIFGKILVGLLFALIISIIAGIFIKLLIDEAKKCIDTQVREVIVAYYHFYEEDNTHQDIT